MKNVVVGIDVGGTNTVYGIVDKDGNIYGEGSIPTQAYQNFEDWSEALHKSIDDKMKELGNEFAIYGIGMGAPNGNYYSGCIEDAVNLNWNGKQNVVTTFKSLFGEDKLVVLTNDANAAAVGEMVYGGAKGMKDFIVITLGTGLGSGVVVNHQVVYGLDGNAGELGHIIFERNGRMCGCGRRGCLETYVSATGIKRTVFDLLANENVPSELRGLSFEEVTSEKIYKAAQKDDQIALMAFEETGKRLGMALADFAAFSTPEAFFLFGGLAKSGDYILEPTKRYMEENLCFIYKDKIKVLLSELNDKNAAVLGAAALAWAELN
ncbi:ROK family protein [Alistipes sp. ZOR0009]|jgi:glucokinase|uniref:ROK family protein n=1 Tax=Alistipes sp. ZOR0009 TaxID=1339253 RepID=UPI0006471A11|nr:ROK family protein [Alistipes sp. ZOR0009]